MMLIMFLMTKHGASVVIFAPVNVLRRYKTVDHVMVRAGDHLGGSWDHVKCDVTAALSHPGVNTWPVWPAWSSSRSGAGDQIFNSAYSQDLKCVAVVDI